MIKDKIKKIRLTSQDVNFFDPNISDKSVRLYKFKDGKNNKFKIWVFTNRIKVEMPLETSLLFSINIPDNVCFANKFLEDMAGIGKLFTNNSKNDNILSCIELLKDDLKTFNFDDTEGLIVYGNSLQIILREDRKILPEIDICKKVKSIIELNYPDNIYRINYSDMPTDLKHLVIEFENWAVSDDFERDDIINRLTKKERIDLTEKIEAKIAMINSYLDSFGEQPLTEGAIKLQCLIELVISLKM